MRLLQVIHGYPPRYNAGSEVYTQTLTRALAARHEVRVFTRHEDPFAPNHRSIDENDEVEPRVRLRVVNNSESRDRYRHPEIDREFERLIDEFEPEVVHFNHLSHLSTSMVRVARDRAVPIVYTLHDFWLMCPRGQFIQRSSGEGEDVFPLCGGQDDERCASRCYSIYFGGGHDSRDDDVAQWTRWVAERMRHVREVATYVDRFIAPSKYLQRRFVNEFGLDARRVTYLDYGFDLGRLQGRRRVAEPRFVLGYIGTHIPAKGIHHLIRAFGSLRGDPVLRIWGRPRDPYTQSLRRMARSLPNDAGARVEWLGEYQNERIVDEVFNHVDAIVVPSIWAENSPLVIHEAQQARVPVVTADLGGMEEYVRHELNGLLFEHRNVDSMSEQMQRFIDDPELARQLGGRGYLFSESGDVPATDAHLKEVEAIYADLVDRRKSVGRAASGPWRITFDTNPDDCNLRCVMCEEHSPHSSLQSERRAAGRPRRRMDIGLIREILEQSAGSRLREVIPSTMGEPLLYEHFDEFIELCREFNVRMNLTTNGTFPRRGARGWAERIVPVASDVKISINGATASTQERIMLGSNFAAIVENARAFVGFRDLHAASGGNYCRVTFQTTFLEENVGELPDLVRLAASVGVDRLKGHHLWAHFTQIEGMSMRRSREAVLMWNEIVALTERAAAEHPLANGKHVLLDNIHRLDPDRLDDIALGGECPFLGEEAWVSAEGRFNPCCAPDAQRRTLGDFGNLQERSLAEIWEGADYTDLRRHYKERALCRSCNMRRPKEGA